MMRAVETCLPCLIQRVSKEPELVILFLGLDNAGKTTFINKLLGRNNPEKTIPTVGFAKPRRLRDIDLNGEKHVFKREIILHDLGGASGFRKAWTARVKHVDAIVFVIDVSDEARWSEAAEELSILMKLDYMPDVICIGAKSAPEEVNTRLKGYFHGNTGLGKESIHFEGSSRTALIDLAERLLTTTEVRNKPAHARQHVYKKTKVVPVEIVEKQSNQEITRSVTCKNRIEERVKGDEISTALCGKEASFRCADTKWMPFCESCYNSVKKSS